MTFELVVAIGVIIRTLSHIIPPRNNSYQKYPTHISMHEGVKNIV